MPRRHPSILITLTSFLDSLSTLTACTACSKDKAAVIRSQDIKETHRWARWGSERQLAQTKPAALEDYIVGSAAKPLTNRVRPASTHHYCPLQLISGWILSTQVRTYQEILGVIRYNQASNILHSVAYDAACPT